MQNNFGLANDDVIDTVSSSARHRAKAAAATRLSCLLLLPTLLACHPQTRPDRVASASAGSDITVLDISKSVYAAAKGTPASANEEAACKAWSLDKQQAASFFRLSKPLAEGELHDYDWLPCTIEGTLQAKGRAWDFEINAAGTSTWRSGGDAVMLGCGQAACEPLVILMRDDPG